MQSKGGLARAAKLSKAERSEIASNAAIAKWKDSKERKLPVAQYGSLDRPLRIGEAEIPCYVLNDGRRVITQAGVLKALDMSQGTATKGGGDRITNFLSTKGINPFVSNDLREMITNMIVFRAEGSKAYAYDALILPEICDSVLQARNSEPGLNYQQKHIAQQCEILLRAFAKVGIIALVDEATGFQEFRDKQALQEILKQYISGELFKWVKTFPIEFYKEIFRLKGWAWNAGKMPGVVGKYTNDLVYDRLAPGLLEELRTVNPPDESSGGRKVHHHRLLTRDIGHPSLTRRLYEMIGMARPFAVGEWDKYYRLVDRVFPRFNTTPELPGIE